jgi:folate-binding protein YgfZ
MTDEEGLAALRAGAALCDAGDRELVVATGADRVRFLHGTVTADVAGTPVGGGCHAALLTVKAHVVAEMYIFVREADLYLVVSGAGQGGPAAEALSRYAIMDDVALALRPDVRLAALLGPTATDHLEAVVGPAAAALAARPLWCHAEILNPPGGGGPIWLARVRRLGAEGFWIGAAPVDLERVTADLRARAVPLLSPAAAEAARIAAGEPAFGREITGDYFPMEVGLGSTIDYGKGCFLGQEPVVRIRDRGHINWRLARLDVAGVSEPAPGDRLESDAKPKAGRVTSSARLPDGRGVALALVHVSVPVGAPVRILHGETALGAVVAADAS